MLDGTGLKNSLFLKKKKSGERGEKKEEMDLQWPAWLFILQLVTGFSEAFCPVMCHCNDRLLEASCVSSRLDTVPILLNPALQTLRLSQNRISSLQQSFTFYSELRHLDLSQNVLHNLGSRHFESLQNLESLNVSGNIITSIEADSLAGLTSLSSLDVSGNRLTILQASLFSDVAGLRTLILSDNKIQTVDEDSFSGLRHLHTLALDGNQLHHVPSASFKRVPNLGSLSLGRNAIDLVGDSAFEGLPVLRVLHLNDNTLRHIESSAFHKLRSLEVLDMSFNRLHSAPLGALSSSLSALKYLDVSGNMWRQLPANLLQGMHSLETLNVSYMEYLHAVDVDAFRSNESSNLQQLIMTNNALWNYFPPGLLDKLVRLRKLDLSGNALKTLPALSILNHGQLEFLNLAYNPLHCNCSLSWLRELFEPSHYNGTLAVTNVTCSAPDSLSGVPLTSLAHDDLQCASSLLWIVVTLSLLMGFALVAILAASLFYCRQRNKRESPKSSGTSPILTKNGSPNSVAHYYQRAIEDDYTYHCSGNTKRIPVTVV